MSTPSFKLPERRLARLSEIPPMVLSAPLTISTPLMFPRNGTRRCSHHGAGDIGADKVALNAVLRSRIDEYAIVGVARDQVAILADIPPTVLSAIPMMLTPLPPLPRGTVPVTSMPM